jgi:hypothetical protein
MHRHMPFPFAWFLSLCALLLFPLTAQEAPAETGKPERKPHLRFLCVTALKENQEVVLATRDEKGDWQEHATFTLKSSFITESYTVKQGELHLALREEGALKSIGTFTYPADSHQLLVLLAADLTKNIYRAKVIDPEKQKFEKGSVLVVNLSTQTGIVILGTGKKTVNAGAQEVVKPVVEANGMYRLLVAHLDAEQKPIPCYDRYVPNNPDSRDVLFLLNDANTGLKVFSLPIFGAFE